MIIGPKFKIARRLNSRVFAKTQTTKFSISGAGAGMKKLGGRRPRALSEYGQQLLEKQKVRYTYLLKEGQFANYVKKVRNYHYQAGGANTRENPTVLLYEALERRLDNVVFRLGLAPTRGAARQMVTHGHIWVNGRRLNIPSHALRDADRVVLRPESRRLGIAKPVEETASEKAKNPPRPVPTWLSYDPETREGKVTGRPLYGETEGDLNFGAILEFYSRV